MNYPARRQALFGCFLAALLAGSAGSAGSAEEVPVKVRRLDDEAVGGWVAVSANFRVYHPQDSALAARTARAAERARAAAYRKWFDKKAASWQPRCEIFLHDPAEYHEEGGLPANVPGYSSVQVDSGRIASRRIDLNRDNPDLLVAILPHEVTHIVLWNCFGQEGFPQWVNEGMAVLTEPRDRVQRHLRNLNRHRRQGELVPIARLVLSHHYPERRLLGPFYAQSVSLVDFLAGVKGPGKFTQFVRDGMRDGYETATQRHYGWTLDELERRWWDHAFATE